MNERLGPVLIGLAGTGLTGEEETWLRHPAVGGVVLFTRNYRDRTQLEALTARIRAAAGRRLLVTVDHEGGRVQRFRDGFTRLPPLGVLGAMHAADSAKALDYAYRHARVMAGELLTAGVDLSFAPVLDLDRGSEVIGDRAFSGDPSVVTALGRAYVAGMHDAGMRVTGKHFPGHGSVAADSHTDDVCDARARAMIEAEDMAPFVALAGELDAMMIAHVVYPAVDERPAGYSRAWLVECLRGELGYEGVILSDDLGMHAAKVAGSLEVRVRDSLAAGCDAVLICGPDDVRAFFEAPPENLPDATVALSGLRGRPPHRLEEMETVSEWRAWKASIAALAERSA